MRWTTTANLRDVYACHCHRCRRTSGNHLAATAVPTARLTIRGRTLRWYSPDDDPNVAYGFCERCGSSLFWRAGSVDRVDSTTSVCVGSVDDPTSLRLGAVWFTDEAAPHTRLDPSVPHHRRNG